MRPITRLAAAAIGVLALSVPAYAGDANHSAGASGMLGGSSHPGTLRPMPRPTGFSVYGDGWHGYNPGYVNAIGTFSHPAYRATQYRNGQRVEGIISNGIFYAKSGTKTTKLSSRPSKARDSRPSPGKANLGNKGASAKGAKGKRK